MSAVDVTEHEKRTLQHGGVSAFWSLSAAALFLASAVFQLLASLQRWIIFARSQPAYRAEDHLFDYSYPIEPWESIGTAAQLFGIGVLLLAFGLVPMALGVITLPRPAPGGSFLGNLIDVIVALLVAGSFALHGAHALLSGVSDTASPLQQYATLGWVSLIGLCILAVRWWRRSAAAMMTSIFLIGSTGLGYYLAAFFVASLFAGYTSHDTTPWTETVIGGWTAAAGVAMIFAAVVAARSSHLFAGKPAGLLDP